MSTKRTIKYKNSIFISVGVFFLIAFVVMSFIWDISFDRKTSIGTVHLSETAIEVEVVRSLHDRSKGLSDRSVLALDTGMLFVFDKSDRHGFWMKDMNFPIDIIWIDESLIIVDIKDNADPGSYPEVFYPQTPARYVLEVNASLAKNLDVIIGSKVSFESIVRD